jgi:hydroxymethylglutaryl-CoA lyase
MSAEVLLVEVGLRDGLQPIVERVPTATKIRLMQQLHAAGIRRAEVSAFVSAQAVPQLADAAEVLAAAKELPDFDPQVLVPSARRGEAAFRAGARHLAFVLSASEAHNRSNVQRSPRESVQDFRTIVTSAPDDARFRLNLATSFDCPFDGPVESQAVLSLLADLLSVRSDMEVALCDTTGRADPNQVEKLFRLAAAEFPQVCGWAFHGHDTYGLGLANVLAAWSAGVHVIDASMGGLGGCPFAPGASGNVASEDVVWAFERMGIRTGISLDALVDVAAASAALPGASSGGRVREAILARRRMRGESNP